jgi:hypothetical protein
LFHDGAPVWNDYFFIKITVYLPARQNKLLKRHIAAPRGPRKQRPRPGSKDLNAALLMLNPKSGLFQKLAESDSTGGMLV